MSRYNVYICVIINESLHDNNTNEMSKYYLLIVISKTNYKCEIRKKK